MGAGGVIGVCGSGFEDCGALSERELEGLRDKVDGGRAGTGGTGEVDLFSGVGVGLPDVEGEANRCESEGRDFDRN